MFYHDGEQAEGRTRSLSWPLLSSHIPPRKDSTVVRVEEWEDLYRCLPDYADLQHSLDRRLSE